MGADGPGSSRELPSALAPLAELALDLRWTFSHSADVLWHAIDRETWEATRNAWFLLQNASRARLDALANDREFLAAMHRLEAERATRLTGCGWCGEELPELADRRIAYFSMEFGLGEALPLYAGGLGMLAGDVLKSAADLGVPLIGVGILFSEGYFRQTIDADGQQHEWFPYNDPTTLPLRPVRTADGAWLRISVRVAGREVWLRAWLASVGRVPLYLLDANDPLNSPADRGITAKLYGGGAEMRLLQELVLGVGGFRLLCSLGQEPHVAHLNEGHAAFATLERARACMLRSRCSFAQALFATRAGNVFTTHTPVAAGFDHFEPRLIERTLLSQDGPFVELGLSARDFLALGRRSLDDDSEPFNMAFLALRCCGFSNAVSELHGAVSRELFAELFPRWPAREVPIAHVTNGVHVPSWDSRAADELWTKACGQGVWLGSPHALESVIAAESDERLWAMRREQRSALVSYARTRLSPQLMRRGDEDAESIAARVLDPEALTLGFARRFAEYKRPNLLLKDPARLTAMLTSQTQPVQLVVAGKAHPADEAGKRMIAEWIHFARGPEVRAKVVFIEDYDIALAEQLTQGVDVWINTPRRPFEACGTSGMKVLVNGGLNLSVRDGWWAEADGDEVGWGFGGSDPASDDADAEQLYALLEQKVIPEFYARDGRGLPARFLERVRASLSRLTPEFSANRMLLDYARRLYLPAALAHEARNAERGKLAGELARWAQALHEHWHELEIGQTDVSQQADGTRRFVVGVRLGGVATDAVRVELFADPEPARADSGLREPMSFQATGPDGVAIFELALKSNRPSSDFAVRIVPYHPAARIPAELTLIRWQD